jgi:hypothetical protein
MRDEKKVPVYVFATSFKQPYSSWVEKPEDDLSEANQRAWDETRALMNRLAALPIPKGK